MTETIPEETQKPSTWTVVMRWIVGALLVGWGGLKLIGNPVDVADFARWGYPSGLRIAIGLAEAAAGVLIIPTRTRFAASILLVATQLFAIVTKVRLGEYSDLLTPGLILAFGLFMLVVDVRKNA